jgi:hypothetical protein|tara:strand:- start:38 stop:235 length:198 start_codon:yes stop_codon:yes gene_type:complete
MLITRKSLISGNTNTMSLPITEEQYNAWEQGTLVQVAMPHLSPDEREFVMTGITPEEWAETFGEE